jgi:Fe-S-cluster containining protein
MENDFFKRLDEIYGIMDDKYKQTAGLYGFECRGCMDNCCLTRFYHHTFMEYLFLLRGFETLFKKKQSEIEKQAMFVITETVAAEKRNEKKIRLMCPLNLGGRCLLYQYRPMICRLHGLPHEIHVPGKKVEYGPGCNEFDIQTKGKAYVLFNRTPYYREMALLEKSFRKKYGIGKKIKMTVAEMITTKPENILPDHETFQY